MKGVGSSLVLRASGLRSSASAAVRGSALRFPGHSGAEGPGAKISLPQGSRDPESEVGAALPHFVAKIPTI